jgi:hypothetical protein
MLISEITFLAHLCGVDMLHEDEQPRPGRKEKPHNHEAGKGADAILEQIGPSGDAGLATGSAHATYTASRVPSRGGVVSVLGIAPVTRSDRAEKA